ncbi:MAG: hypothetical protein II951_11610 [Bacteroidales bacterium]|nr:hypothetical protein [Bacteroidales bacterium]
MRNQGGTTSSAAMLADKYRGEGADAGDGEAKAVISKKEKEKERVKTPNLFQLC